MRTWGVAVSLVLALAGAGAVGGCGSGSGGAGGASGTGVARGGAGGQSSAGGASAGRGGSVGGGGGAGTGGGGGGTGGTRADASADGLDGGESDAAVCSPSNFLFDCPENFACNATTRRCTQQCSDTQPCRGGCCRNGTCQPGTDVTACGHDGMSCDSCSATFGDGPLCLPWPYPGSPTQPGGYCGCMTAADCTAAWSGVCEPELTLTKKCCTRSGQSCSLVNPGACCSGVCDNGTCG